MESDGSYEIGAAFTALVLQIFRFHGRLFLAGDRLASRSHECPVASFLGAVEQRSLPVAQIGRNLGLARQSVQRVADALEDVRPHSV
jgi:hypothetical protein